MYSISDKAPLQNCFNCVSIKRQIFLLSLFIMVMWTNIILAKLGKKSGNRKQCSICHFDTVQKYSQNNPSMLRIWDKHVYSFYSVLWYLVCNFYSFQLSYEKLKNVKTKKSNLPGRLHFRIDMEDMALRFFTLSHMPRTSYTLPSTSCRSR
jgi:hypothetical protein